MMKFKSVTEQARNKCLNVTLHKIRKLTLTRQNHNTGYCEGLVIRHKI